MLKLYRNTVHVFYFLLPMDNDQLTIYTHDASLSFEINIVSVFGLGLSRNEPQGPPG